MRKGTFSCRLLEWWLGFEKTARRKRRPTRTSGQAHRGPTVIMAVVSDDGERTGDESRRSRGHGAPLWPGLFPFGGTTSALRRGRGGSGPDDRVSGRDDRLGRVARIDDERRVGDDPIPVVGGVVGHD